MPGVKRERDESVGVLTLDEPATLNAMTPDLLGDLAIAIGEMTDDPQVRALVLTGAGRGFCSGQNLKAAQILGDDIVTGNTGHDHFSSGDNHTENKDEDSGDDDSVVV